MKVAPPRRIGDRVVNQVDFTLTLNVNVSEEILCSEVVPSESEWEEGGIKSGMQCSGPSTLRRHRRRSRTKFELALNQMRDGVGGGGEAKARAGAGGPHYPF